jgi:hypothetical protein
MTWPENPEEPPTTPSSPRIVSTANAALNAAAWSSPGRSGNTRKMMFLVVATTPLRMILPPADIQHAHLGHVNRPSRHITFFQTFPGAQP